jgi:hypothetical protein
LEELSNGKRKLAEASEEGCRANDDDDDSILLDIFVLVVYVRLLCSI